MMRKIIVIGFVILLSAPFVGHSQKIQWMSFEEAIKRNQEFPKKIFIDVYTDWCGWCTRMDQTTFQDSAVIAYMNQEFYAVKFNAEGKDTIVFNNYTFVNPQPEGKRSTHQLAATLLRGKMSYPSYVFMNEKNEFLTVVPGYVQAVQFLPILKYFGTNAFLSTKWEDYQKNELTQP